MKITKSQATKLYVKLSWELLEHKFVYYHAEIPNLKISKELKKKLDKIRITDEAYDKKESIYKKLCKLLKKKPYTSNHVGFPHTKGSGRLVIEKMLKL